MAQTLDAEQEAAKALAECRCELDDARADLEAAIGRIVGSIEPWGLFDEDEGGKRRLDKEALAELLDNVDQAEGAVAAALDDFDWRTRRAWRALDKAQRLVTPT